MTWADAIVIASLRDDVVDDVRRVLELRGSTPTAFVDGEDHPYVRGIADQVDVYFKRETLRRSIRLRARMPLRRVVSPPALPGVVGGSAPARDRRRDRTFTRGRSAPVRRSSKRASSRRGERDVDVAFLASPTSPERAGVAAGLRELERDGAVVQSATAASLSWPDYMQLLARSRIAVSVRGLGYDTYRYWEIPYAGALLLSESPRTVIPGNFVDGREAVFAPIDKLAERARDLLSRDTSAIAAAGRQKLLAQHTSVQRAQTVLDRMRAVRDH